VPFADRYFVYRKTAQVLQARFAVFPVQVIFVNLFDRIPGNIQVAGCVTDRHESTKLTHIAFKGSAAGSVFGGKAQLDLTQLLTPGAINPGDIEPRVVFARPRRDQHNDSFYAPPALNVTRTTNGATYKTLLRMNLKNTRPAFIEYPFVGIANYVLSVIQ
jgi:hypothetical protein